MDILMVLWVLIQVLIGYNLIIPIIIYCLWRLLKAKKIPQHAKTDLDHAFIVTAYQFTATLPSVVNSILKLDYQNYLIYVVADNCNIADLHFDSDRVVLLKPPSTLSSNTKSHAYAIANFVRQHDVLTIIDSDNLLHRDFANAVNVLFEKGFEAVQGLRAAKNLTGTIASLDAARDIYYHFYDGKLLFECGSSATLAGSGMSFKSNLYQQFLATYVVEGAGFDKVLQAWIVRNNLRIAFCEDAIVYDEKTSRPDQLVKQRSRWINTWFKYFKYGFEILFIGLRKFNFNQSLFGLILLRPPLFLFLIASFVCFVSNILIGNYISALSWLLAMALFVCSFFIALISSSADGNIYKSLKDIPKFMIYQVSSLLKARSANKISVSTQHYYEEEQRNKDE